jgi:hypothetical protein
MALPAHLEAIYTGKPNSIVKRLFLRNRDLQGRLLVAMHYLVDPRSAHETGGRLKPIFEVSVKTSAFA